ncbi:MAG: ribosomal protein S6--L-glutamate ligase [Patescibacteria group bacterium]|nr:ribosomal protein S6--L-glutamate ligase [Patescibacteria group bacterium]
MMDTKHFDVLVVYSSNIAASAALYSQNRNTPFTPDSSYNQAYQYLLESCKKKGLTAAFSTTADITGAGQCDSYWVVENKTWKKVNNSCLSLNIFDKFSDKGSALQAAQSLCFSSDEIKPFNSKFLKKIFTDKLKTYNLLAEFCIPTVALKTKNQATITQSLTHLMQLVASHPQSADFSSTIIMKDRKGAEGNLIFKIEKPTAAKVSHIITQNPGIQFILQPFVHFDKGFAYKNLETATDIRLMFQKGKIIQTYIRTAKKGDFRCNQHQGGTVIYTDVSEIPQKVLDHAQKVSAALGKRKGLYAIDFIVSNSGAVYMLEGNCNPGIVWDLNFKQDELMAKELIRGIVDEFVLRSADKIATPALPSPLHQYTAPVYTALPAPVLLQ